MQEQKTIKKKEVLKKASINSTRRLTYIATLVSMTVMFKILSNFFVISNSLRIGFTYFGWIISAVFLGPIGGAAVGFCSDVIAMLIAPNGTFTPFITLGNTIFPLIVGLCYKYLPLKSKQACLCIGVAISTIVCTLGINSLALYYMYDYSLSMNFLTYLIAFRYSQPIVITFNLALALICVPIIKRLKMFDNF